MTASEKTLPSVFSLLREALGIYARHFSFYFGYAAWLLIPTVISVLARTSLDAETVYAVDLIFGITLYAVLSVFVTVIIIKSLPDIRRHQPITTNLVRNALVLAVPYLLTTILVSLLTFGGLLLFVIPGILISTWFAFAGIIVVIEQKPIIASLQTSRALVEKRFFSVLGRYYIGFLLMYLAYGALAIGALALAFAAQGGGVIDNLISLSNLNELPPLTLMEDALLRLVDILFVPFNAIYPALLYLYLKRDNVAPKNAIV